MSGLKFDTAGFRAMVESKREQAQYEAVRTVHRATNDLARISSNIAPIDKGPLRQSVKSEIKWRARAQEAVGTVSFSAVVKSAGYGRFNYALWTHEAEYKLGPDSKAEPGVDGYSVGNKYLERPLYGEAAKYLRWWGEDVGKVLGP